MRTFFGDVLDIAENLVVVNARLSQSPEMVNFRKTLKFAHDEIKVGADVMSFSFQEDMIMTFQNLLHEGQSIILCELWIVSFFLVSMFYCT